MAFDNLSFNPLNYITYLNINGVIQDGVSTNRQYLNTFSDTGIISFDGLSMSGSNTINIGACRAWIVDNEIDVLFPTKTYIEFSGQTNVPVTTITGTNENSYVLLTSGATIDFINNSPTSSQRKESILLGVVNHPNGIINSVFDKPDFNISPNSQVRDLYRVLNLINGGIFANFNGSNLNLDLNSGIVYGYGINYVNDKSNPNAYLVSSGATVPFVYRTQTGGTSGYVSVIDPTNYDFGGIITPISGSSTQATIQYIYYVLGSGIGIQYGQTVYPTLSQAILGIGKESFVQYFNLETNSILIGMLAVTKGATALDNTSQAVFVRADKFGQPIGVSGGLLNTTDFYTTGATLIGTTAYFNRNDALSAYTLDFSSFSGSGFDVYVTGGTFNNNTNTLTIVNNSGGTFNVTGFTDFYTTGATVIGTTAYFDRNNALSAYTLDLSAFSGSMDTYVTGYTYSNNNFTIQQNNGQPELTTFVDNFSGLTINGDFNVTGNTNLNNLTASTVSASTYFNLPTDIFVTGGTFDNNTDILTLINNTGGTFSVTGFTDYYTTGTTLVGTTAYFDRNDILSAYTLDLSSFSGSTDTYVTGFTYLNNSFTIQQNNGQPDLVIIVNNYTGLTINGDFNVTGSTILNDLTATTVSATTYFNLPTDIFVTGGTFDDNTDTLTLVNNTGGTFNVTGFTDFYTTGLTFNLSNYDLTVSLNNGTNYTQNLAILASDMTITGGSYNPNTGNVTFTNNTGGTFTVTGFTTGMTDTYTTGGTFDNNTDTITFTKNNGGTYSVTGLTDFYTTGTSLVGNIAYFDRNDVLSAYTLDLTTFNVDTYVTGFTYSNNNLTIQQNNGQPDLSVLVNTMTGLTINGNLSASTISSSTITVSGVTFNKLLTEKVGAVSGSSFSGSPRTYDVVFSSNFPDTNYAITITGPVERSWTYSNQTISGFTISANASIAFGGLVYYIAKSIGEV